MSCVSRHYEDKGNGRGKIDIAPKKPIPKCSESLVTMKSEGIGHSPAYNLISQYLSEKVGIGTVITIFAHDERLTPGITEVGGSAVPAIGQMRGYRDPKRRPDGNELSHRRVGPSARRSGLN